MSIKITDERWPDGSGKVTYKKVTDNRIGGGSSNNDFTGW